MKNRLKKESLVSLIAGLALAAFVIPWSFSTISKSNELLRQQQEMLTPLAPSTQGIAVDERTLDEQFARAKVAERDPIAIHRPVHLARASEPSRSAYSIVPQGSSELVPLDGWVDQPNKDRPGRLHTNLKWRWANKAKPRPSGTGKVSDAEPMLDEPPNTRFEPGYIMVAWSGTDDRAQEHAKPRDDKQTKTERKRDTPPPKAREGEQTKTQAPADRSDAQRRQPQSTNDGRRDRDNNGDRSTKTDAQRRQPRPNGNYDRYSWRKYDGRSHGARDRFPRSYGGSRYFDRRFYRGNLFGSHDRLWYSYRNAWRLFYWPYPYAPLYGCGWYFVPTDRVLVYDPYSREEYWEYTNYERAYLCFD